MKFEDNVLLEIGAQEWAMWQHTPITAAFLQFLDDQITVWREIAADLVEAGAYRLDSPHEDTNPDVVRGKLLALRQLRGITLENIQAFYGKEPPAETEEDQAHD